MSTLEDLPNEILLNILEYLSTPAELHQSFYRLNDRFDHLLRSLRLSVDVFWEDKDALTLMHYFAWNFNRLRLFNTCPSICLHRLNDLRSLTMVEPTDAQIHSLHSRTLPLLEHLASPASMHIFDCLFGTSAQQWASLRSCNFYFCHFPDAKCCWQMNTVLRSLSGVICSRKTLSELLSLLPCLDYLRVDLTGNDWSAWNRSSFRRTLRSLHIRFEQLIIDDLCTLIGPNLRRLNIEVRDEQQPIDFQLLGQALLDSLSKPLKRFQCDYRGRKVSMNSIRMAHVLFENVQYIPLVSYDTHRLICVEMGAFHRLEEAP